MGPWVSSRGWHTLGVRVDQALIVSSPGQGGQELRGEGSLGGRLPAQPPSPAPLPADRPSHPWETQSGPQWPWTQVWQVGARPLSQGTVAPTLQTQRPPVSRGLQPLCFRGHRWTSGLPASRKTHRKGPRSVWVWEPGCTGFLQAWVEGMRGGWGFQDRGGAPQPSRSPGRGALLAPGTCP